MCGYWVILSAAKDLGKDGTGFFAALRMTLCRICRKQAAISAGSIFLQSRMPHAKTQRREAREANLYLVNRDNEGDL
jgi:hypothetical protein